MSRTEKSDAPDLTVFVVDDDPEVRTSLHQLLTSVSLAVETFESAQDFLENVDPEQYGCVVSDIRMPGMSGLELQRQMVRLGYQMPVVVITAYADVATAVDSMKLGAVDFVTKPYRPQELVDTVQQIHETIRESWNSTRDLNILLEQHSQLTKREREVFQLIGEGRSTKQIALELGIGLTTVDFHRANVLKKFGTDNVATIARAYERLRSHL